MFIDKQPQIFTPAYNPVLFMISSTYSNVLFFNLQLNDIETGTRIINDKAYVTPVTPTSTHYNPSDIAKDLVTWQIVNDGTIARAITKSTRLIQLKGSDNGVVGNTMSQLGQTASSNQFTVWNGQFPRHEFTDYNYQEWVTGGTGSINFLTQKPNYSLVNDTTRDFLYYLKVPSFTASTVLITKYDSARNVLGSFTTNFTGTSSMVRLDVSPKAIKLVQPTFFSGAIDSYSVQLYNVSLPISEVKTFRYDNSDCNKDVVNILWQNNLGGIDSYQFVNPVETKNVERFQIRKNPYQYSDTYQYTDIDQSTYNDKERVVHNNPTSQWTMYTRPLTNNESRWLAKIVNAKRWWIELTSGRTYPVSLIESSYIVQNTKYVRDNVVTAQLTFNVIDDNIEYDQIYAGTASIALVATTTTTTTSTSTSTTTGGSSTTTTSTTTSTTTTITSFSNSGYGDSTATACSDKEANNRTLYSNCSSIAASCIIYTDSGGTLPLLGYTHIFIDGLNWLINSSTGAITGVDPVQC